MAFGGKRPRLGRCTITNMAERGKPWMFRTYAGHTSAASSNALYKRNLAKGQTGLSVAFDLPTQTGYDADDPMARGEVGKVGVPVGHIGDMRTLFDGIPVEKMNTSMTINATAMWLLSLYVAVADEQGVPRTALQGTTQNDILKEYLSRGTHIYPPVPSLRLITDMIVFCATEVPKWNPINVCSYHLQEAGAEPWQEVAYTLANAVSVLDAVRATGAVPENKFEEVVGRISFFCNAGIRFVEEMCKMRAFNELWDRITSERYGVTNPKYRRFRYGVQVNSLGLAALQPENNVYRILLEALGVTLSKDARARAVQLPAWNEALGLPRPWDQQWSIRMQQILAYETDILEYDDLFAGSKAVEEKTAEISDAAWAELQRLLGLGGALEAIEEMKNGLVGSLAKRQRAIEAGDITVVGVNAFTEAEPSPLADDEFMYEKLDPEAEAQATASLEEFRRTRDDAAVRTTLDDLKRAAATGENLVPFSIACARAGVTTGEWAGTLRSVFGEYRPPTGVGSVPAAPNGLASLATAREAVARAAKQLGVSRLRMLVGKPGLDGHSNGAEQVAVRARDAGFEVVYQGIRLTPEAIARAAADEDVHVVGLSILSGGHAMLVPEVIRLMKEHGVDPARVPVVVGGIIPEADERMLLSNGVARVYTPRDYDLTNMMREVADLIAARQS
ncbi:MAG: protein meaA [Actinobacteria bacterium]|nr:protein meaA [Actinomycetota bacterium]